MLRLIARSLGILLLIFILVPAGFSKNLARKAKKELRKTDNAITGTSSSSTTASSEPAKPVESGNSEETSTAAPAIPALNATNDKNGTNDDYKPAPRFTPMLATTGTIGLFTLETADTIPKHGFAFSAFGNKFGRMPGSVTILEMGADLSYGITENLNVYGAFDPYRHVHVRCPG